jgi:NAD(P)-dependent dehydrogenase (short-subunit alcohol dehydrogenase family)
MFHGRDVERGTTLAREFGQRARFIDAELANPNLLQMMVETTVKEFGRLDGLVNNAASVARSELEQTDATFFDQMMAVNLRAPLLLIRAAIPYLKQSRGCVLNIGSINAYCGESHLLAYSISKGGLMTLSRNLADALCHDGVRVNHFNVGWVLSPNEYKQKIADGLPADWQEHVDPMFAPSGRIMEPAMIAAAAVYWLSDESRPISGSVVELEQYPVIGRNPTKRGN